MALLPASCSRSFSFLFPAVVAIAALAAGLPAARAQQTDAAAPGQGVDPLSPEMRAPAHPRLGVHYKASVIAPSGARQGAIRNGVTPTCSSPHLSYFGGPVISHVQSVAVFWNSDVNPEIQSKMAQFLADMANSSYMSAMAEYGTYGSAVGSTKTNQVIGNGSSTVQGITLVPSRCAAGSVNCHVSDSQIQSELNAQIAASHLPAPTYDSNGNAQTLYMVFFPPKVTTDDGFGDQSCVQYCAFHNTGGTIGAPLLYGVLMDEYTSACATGCGNEDSHFKNSTNTASHEFAEAITDPEIGLDTSFNYAYPAAWGDNNNSCGEIGDICDSGLGDTITVSGRPWTVQELWSNVLPGCTSTGTITPPFLVGMTGSATTGTPFSFTLTAKNPTGSTDNTYSGTVHLTSSDADASLPADYTFVAGDSGVHTFNVTFQTAGAQSITATDTSNADLTGTNSIAVTQSSPFISSPTPGSTLPGSSATFTWNPGTATSFILRLGTTLGSNNIYGSGTTTATSKTVNTLPTNGVTLYARLSYLESSVWHNIDYTYTEAGLPTPPSMTTPATDSMLTASSQTFTWNPGGGSTSFQLNVGTTGVGSGNIFKSGWVTGNSANVTGIPTTGAKLYVRLMYRINGVWSNIDYLYTEYAPPASMTSPAPSSTLTGSSQTFSWDPGAATQFQLNVGTKGAGSGNVFKSGWITTPSANVTNIPTIGATLNVRLLYRISGVWYSTDYVYTEYTLPASMTTPPPGSTLTGSSQTFTWDPGAATQFQLNVGTKGAGSGNVYKSGWITTTSANVPTIPTTGATLNVRLLYRVNGVWSYVDYTYTEF